MNHIHLDDIEVEISQLTSITQKLKALTAYDITHNNVHWHKKTYNEVVLFPQMKAFYNDNSFIY